MLNRRYTNMFEGYEKRTVLDKYGNEKSKYIYCGNYYVPKLSSGAFTGRKVMNVLLLLLAAAVQLFAGLQYISLNTVNYVNVGQAASIIATIMWTVYVIVHATTVKKMELHYYKGAHKKLMIVSLVAWIVYAITFVLALVAVVSAQGDQTTISFLCVASYLVAACCAFIVWFKEFKTEYDTVLQ